MAEQRDDLVSKLIEVKTGYNKQLEHNFIFQNELTVQITLAEYRSLIGLQSIHAKALDEERAKRYKLEFELAEMKKRLTILTEKLTETQMSSNDVGVMEEI